MPPDGSLCILLTRLSHVGDCVLTLPLLTALRRRFPRATLAWAVEPPADQLLRDHPDLDRLLVVPRNWMQRWREIPELRRQLRQLAPHLVLDPQSLSKSALLGWLSGAPLRIGMGGSYARELARWLNNRRIAPRTTHLVDRSLELLAALGLDPVQAEFRLPLSAEAREGASRFIDSNGLAGGFVVINPGASWPSKQWELDRFASVASHLGSRWGLRSVVTWAGSRELEMAQAIVHGAAGAALVAPPTDLRELAALLARALAYVGCDTGPMHLAAAVGTPCLALFGPTRPECSGPYGAQHLCLQAWYQGGGSRRRRRGANDAMRDLSVSAVSQAADLLISRLVSRCLSA